MSRDPALYLGHILESIDFIQSYVADLDRDAFLVDHQVQDAVLRRIEIIGEAAKNLPADLTEANPQLPWRRIAGTRDKVIHDYFGIDVELIWNIVESLLPELRAEVQSMLHDLNTGDGTA